MMRVSAIHTTIRSFFVLFCLIFLGGVQASAQNPSIDNEEQSMLGIINDYRAKKGLGPLRISVSLSRAADWMNKDMADKNYFDHTDSRGRDPFTRMADYGYRYYPSTRGENLAAGNSDAARTFNQWRNSPGHNANMLNGKYNVIGISRVYKGSSYYKWYWTTDFGSYVDETFGREQTVSRNVNSERQMCNGNSPTVSLSAVVRKGRRKTD